MDFHVHKRSVILIIVILALMLVFLLSRLVHQYFEISPAQFINHERFARLRKDHVMLGENDVGTIAPWMTFDYINHVFGLPGEYLQSADSISDSRYPRLTLSRYAHDSGLDINTFTIGIQSKVKNYFISAPK